MLNRAEPTRRLARALLPCHVAARAISLRPIMSQISGESSITPRARSEARSEVCRHAAR